MNFISSFINRMHDKAKIGTVETRYGALWPFPVEAGIGLHIVSSNVDPRQFLDAIIGAGCDQKTAARLTSNLFFNGEIKTTISHSVDLNSAIFDMEKAGTTVKVIPPAQRYLDGLAQQQ